MSKVNMSNLIPFLCASSKMPATVFTHHATSEGYIELCKSIKEACDNKEKYGSESPMYDLMHKNFSALVERIIIICRKYANEEEYEVINCLEYMQDKIICFICRETNMSVTYMFNTDMVLITNLVNGEFKNADISECNLISDDFIEKLNSNLGKLEEVIREVL